jgi:hypothetical protein
MQAGLISNPMNDMSSCESGSGAEDPSLRRSLRGGRKPKVHIARRLQRTLHV